MRNLRYPICLLFFFASCRLFAQSLPVGTPLLEDYLRRQQLLNEVDSSLSFSVRPLFQSDIKGLNDVYQDSILKDNTFLKFNGSASFDSGRGVIKLLPLNWQQQYNSNYPYGWNDGSMIPAAGYQTVVSGGFFAKYGPLSVQLRPEFVWAQNQYFEGFPNEHYDEIWAAYYSTTLNVIDNPERFGTSSYSKANWGQSSVRLTFDPVSLGISNENLWWGPGVRNSLLMSNNAAGFKHITLNTSKPIRSYIGSFEGQIVAGKLENSGMFPPEINRVFNGSVLYQPKRDEWRYFTGYVFTYQPKWVPGLTLGMTRAFQMYHSDVHGFGDYFPLFQAFQKIDTDEYNKERDQLTSLFFRWLWTDAKAEIYAEYGRNDHAEDFRDFILEPDHTRAYLLGFRKAIPLNKHKDEYILTSVELTQMDQSANRTIRDGGAWYVHSQIRQGYTNQGQVLGAGIGPGGNLQSVDVSWFSGLKHLGVQFERYLHNNDFYYYAYSTYSPYSKTNDPRRHWVDLNYSVYGEWNFKNLLLNAKLTAVHSLNYEWFLYDRPEEYSFFKSGWDSHNFAAQLGVSYRF
ncbi:hypothetical protein GS399_12100 [Pedobacter sp. HMF7647]|uniref:Capsule assembly Wzi family protein n=1 Tax=Hufsiella arboris TaxID=2695275 RepID=A0A7K1YAV0_9SPHI|nr:capsule assembly Wzi family protein [Hufsiella arboris]MXV51717.1 hypothetical protein [Hufsiella arboris]